MNLIYNEIYHPILLWYIACIPKYGKHQLYDKLTEELEPIQGAKKIIFTACHLGKLKLAFTSPDVISTSPKIFFTSRIDFTVLLLFKLLKKYHLPVGQVKNRIH